jgi:hypothetical protein
LNGREFEISAYMSINNLQTFISEKRKTRITKELYQLSYWKR